MRTALGLGVSPPIGLGLGRRRQLPQRIPLEVHDRRRCGKDCNTSTRRVDRNEYTEYTMGFCEARAAVSSCGRQRHTLHLGEIKMLKGNGFIKHSPCVYLLCSVVLGLIALIGMNGCTNGSDTDSAGSTSYHSYNQITQELSEIESHHHDIARLFSIGKTTEGRDVWAIKISSNAQKMCLNLLY